MLSEEEKQAINYLKECVIKENLFEEDFILYNIKILLNLITKLQKESKEKDKQIDLIIEEYEYNARINFKNFCEDELRKDSCIQDCKTCAKQYFEKLAKEKGE